MGARREPRPTTCSVSAWASCYRGHVQFPSASLRRSRRTGKRLRPPIELRSSPRSMSRQWRNCSRAFWLPSCLTFTSSPTANPLIRFLNRQDRLGVVRTDRLSPATDLIAQDTEGQRRRPDPLRVYTESGRNPYDLVELLTPLQPVPGTARRARCTLPAPQVLRRAS
jgi:hypothetical protein